MKKIRSTVLLCATVLFISCKDTVLPVLVTDVTINKNVLSLVLGAKEALVATVNPKDADDKSLIWSSSDVAVATVSTTGEVSALNAGVATITVTSNSDKTKKATCALTVTSTTVEVTGVELDKPTLNVAMGMTATLVSTVLPQTATNKEVTWTSSNVDIATVSASGVVTPVSAGTVTITVTSNSDKTKKATCEVTVPSATVNVTGVTLDQSTLRLTMGMQAVLVSTVLPQTATNKEVTWTSSDVAVASVSAFGVVTPVSVGIASITVASNSDNTKKATCEVTVGAIDVTEVTLDQITADVNIGDTYLLTATIVPGNATNKEVTWTSSDDAIATVSASGLVTPVSAGTASITATSNSDNTKKATCEVTVKAVAVTSVGLSKSDLTIKMGNTATLVATVYPTNATNKKVTWKSTVPAVATVSDTGVVTPVSEGESVITITSDSDATIKAACVVTIEL